MAQRRQRGQGTHQQRSAEHRAVSLGPNLKLQSGVCPDACEQQIGVNSSEIQSQYRVLGSSKYDTSIPISP